MLNLNKPCLSLSTFSPTPLKAKDVYAPQKRGKQYSFPYIFAKTDVNNYFFVESLPNLKGYLEIIDLVSGYLMPVTEILDTERTKINGAT